MKDGEYHLSADLVDHAIGMIADAKQVAPEKPVLHVLLPRREPCPASLAQGVGGQVQGQVRHGLREDPRDDPGEPEEDGHRAAQHRTVARSTRYADRKSVDGKPWSPADIVRPWDSLSDDEKKLFARMAEVYAGFCSYTDHEIGRLIDYLEEIRAARQHPHRGHLGQRRVGRRRPQRLRQREQVLQQRPGRHGREPEAARQARVARTRTTTIPPAGRWRSTRRSRCSSATPGRRHLRPDDRALAQGHQGQGRGARPVHALQRHRADGLRLPGHRAAGRGQGLHPVAAGRARASSTASTTPRPRRRRTPVLRRCWARAASGARAGRSMPFMPGARRLGSLHRGQVGAVSTPKWIAPSATTWPTRTP